jgi:hypothetical protein
MMKLRFQHSEMMATEGAPAIAVDCAHKQLAEKLRVMPRAENKNARFQA